MTNYEYMKDYYKYTNWRFVGNGNINPIYDHSKYAPFRSRKRGVWVLLDSYAHSCFIYGLTIKKFLQISEDGNYHFFRDHYWDTASTSYCKTCNGAGKTDWISRITGPQPFDKIRNKYIRDKDKILTIQNNDFLKDYIFAPTKVFDGERICKDCKGTGVYINSHNLKKLSSYNTDEIWQGGLHEELSY